MSETIKLNLIWAVAIFAVLSTIAWAMAYDATHSPLMSAAQYLAENCEFGADRAALPACVAFAERVRSGAALADPASNQHRE